MNKKNKPSVQRETVKKVKYEERIGQVERLIRFISTSAGAASKFFF